MKRKNVLVLSVIMPLIVLGALMLVMGGEMPTVLADGDSEPLFEFQKKIEPVGEVLTVGDRFTVTLTISPTAATQNLTYTWPITVYDPNMGYPLGNSGIYQFISTTLETYGPLSTTHPATWDWDRNGVIWSTAISETITEKMYVVFQGEIYDVPSAYDPTGTITNNAYIEAGAFNEPDGTPGSLPGSLPGSIPGSIVFDPGTPGSLPGSAPEPGSLPGSEVGHTMYTSDTMEIKPTAFEMTPNSVVTDTPYAIQVYTLTLKNTSGTEDVFLFTDASTSTSALTPPANLWNVVRPTSITVGAGLSATVNITVEIPEAEVKWVTHTATITATSQNQGTAVASELTTLTGGYWNGTAWVGCRHDFDYSGRVMPSDILETADRVYAYDQPQYDFDHSGRVMPADILVTADSVYMYRSYP